MSQHLQGYQLPIPLQSLITLVPPPQLPATTDMAFWSHPVHWPGPVAQVSHLSENQAEVKKCLAIPFNLHL